MLYYQRFTTLKTHEVENMGKKTVPIAVPITPRKKAYRITEGGTVALHAAGNFRTVPTDTGSKRSSGTSTSISAAHSVTWHRNMEEAQTGYGTVYGTHQ
jgi:hypothetical protein